MSIGVAEVLHPATDELIDKFAQALKDKALAAQKKHGYADGWLTDDWYVELGRQFHIHVNKGDPRDVAIYAAFAWGRGWLIPPPANRQAVTAPGADRAAPSPTP